MIFFFNNLFFGWEEKGLFFKNPKDQRFNDLFFLDPCQKSFPF